MSDRGIYMQMLGGHHACLYRYEPGDMYCEIQGLGIAVRNSLGETILVGAGSANHRFDTAGLTLGWRAACV